MPMDAASTALQSASLLRSDWYVSALEKLVGVVQDLSHARTIDEVTAIVRKAARELTGADGATFVLRDGDNCYYAEENAIGPLWKGKRFPMENCVSGWVMLNAKAAIIEDIYQDPRVPAEAYRPTFVKSLAMVPIRLSKPVGAIGNYWAKNRKPTEEEISILQALANVTSIALENVELYAQLQGKVKALQETNHELGRFAWSASHDLKSPLRAIDNLSGWIEEDAQSKLHAESREHLATIRRRVRRMDKLLDDILEFSMAEKNVLTSAVSDMVDGSTLIAECKDLLDIPPGFYIGIDKRMPRLLLRRMPLARIFCNLIENGIKHHDKQQGRIEIGVDEDVNNYIFSFRDDGPGVPPEFRTKIFDMFQTLRPRDRTEGSGMGLSLVRKILSIYGAEISVEAAPERGAVFKFTWPKHLCGVEQS